MQTLISVLAASLFGGMICAIAQLFIDLTALTPARILTSLVCIGVFIYAIGLYEPLFNMFGEGIALPLTGFGGAIARGVEESVGSDGAIGILKGGLSATSTGITLALILGLIASLTVGKRPKRM